MSEEMSDSDRESDLEERSQEIEKAKDPYLPRLVKIKKSDRGFGFNVRGQVSEGGQLRSINGHLYPPLQMISAVLEGGPAEKAGVLVGDRILAVNTENVEGTEHRRVVELIRKGGDELTLVIISVTPSEARKLDGPAEISVNRDYIDYSDRRSVAINIPDLRHEESNGEKYVVYNIHIGSKFICARRYSDFSQLHNDLKKQFRDYPFPKFPSKWPFALSEQQLDSRRRNLESFLEDVCSVVVISEASSMKSFLQEEEKQS